MTASSSRPTTTRIGGGGPKIIPCNWLQHYENLVDPFHVVILHGSFSGTQFVDGDVADARRHLGRDAARREDGVAAQAARRLDLAPHQRSRRCRRCA